jgi:ABC-type branched-subunit amino acid transport system permease subunit
MEDFVKRNLYKGLFFGLVAVFFLLLPFLTPYRSLATEMIIFAIFALGYDIVFGYTGLLSLPSQLPSVWWLPSSLPF